MTERRVLFRVAAQPTGWLGWSLTGALVERLEGGRGTLPELATLTSLTYYDGRVVQRIVHPNFLAEIANFDLAPIEPQKSEEPGCNPAPCVPTPHRKARR